MKNSLGNEVQDVRFTHRLKNHPVCLTSEGNMSVEMAKTLSSMPNGQKIQAQTVLEINENHEIAQKLQKLFEEDKERYCIEPKALEIVPDSMLFEQINVGVLCKLLERNKPIIVLKIVEYDGTANALDVSTNEALWVNNNEWVEIYPNAHIHLN